MAARIRIEWVSLGFGYQTNGVAMNVVGSVLSAVNLNVTTSATDAGSRPVAPAPSQGGSLYARLTALDNPVIAAWGADPTATSTNGVRLCVDQPEVVPVLTGDKLSFLEVT